MSLNIGKRDVAAMASVLDGEYETVEDAAKAVLNAAFAMYEAKAKYTVVGQLHYLPGVGTLSPDDKRAGMVALGRYGTETAARNDALAMAVSIPTGLQFKTWVLPVHHGTPASHMAARKKAMQAEVDKAKTEEREARFTENGARSMDQALRALAEEKGWLSPEELVEERPVCEHCGQELEPPSPLESGYATQERGDA